MKNLTFNTFIQQQFNRQNSAFGMQGLRVRVSPTIPSFQIIKNTSAIIYLITIWFVIQYSVLQFFSSVGVEHLSDTQKVIGSSPIRTTIFMLLSSNGSTCDFLSQNHGSNPCLSTISNSYLLISVFCIGGYKYSGFQMFRNISKYLQQY